MGEGGKGRRRARGLSRPEPWQSGLVLNARANSREERIMRNLMLATAALASAGVTTLAATYPAAAIDYPYCIQGGGWGVPGDCSYRSYAECMAAASGRRVYCNVNPRVAFGRQYRARRYSDY